MEQNIFLKAYEKRIKEVAYKIQTASFMSEPPGGVKLSEVVNLMNGCVAEIKKQDAKINVLNVTIDELIKENTRLNSLLFSEDEIIV